MSGGRVTTHALDTARGCPAAGLEVRLEALADGRWQELARGATNADGRLPGFTDGLALPVGTYRITFETGGYFRLQGTTGFYPYVAVVFELAEPRGHYHVPLLLSPWGYSTYRGS